MAPTASEPVPDVRTARTAGLFYLALVITGILGFLLVRPLLSHPGDPAATLDALRSQDLLAGVGIALELGIVLAQALVALWLFRLFLRVDTTGAAAVLVFGMVNATLILASTAMLTTARSAASGAAAGGLDTELVVGTAYLVSESLWDVATLFFGLWLIPLGLLVLRSGWMPRVLGWFLIAGGAGHALSAYTAALLPEATLVGTILSAPANVGEFWLAGYLIIFGARRRAARAESDTAERSVP